ncbi:unnamed protein product, partial [Nezara viridula]
TAPQSSIFCEKGVKIAAKNYQLLEPVAKLLNDTLLEVIGLSSRIPLPLKRIGQLSTGCKRTYLPRIGSR